MGRRRYTNESRAQVMAALLAGQSIRAVARQYRIPEGTVASWKRTLNGPLDNMHDAEKREVGDLILGYLRELLVTTRGQLKVFRDEKWLGNQPASEAAVLHGVLADKAIRLLEALAGDVEAAK